MDAVVNRFIHVLKLNGLRISPAETIDSLRGLAFSALADRETVRVILGCTLIKDTRDLPLFEHLFEAFFTLPELAHDHGHHHDHDHSHDEPGEPTRIALQPDEPGVNQNEHTHDEPSDVRDYFDPEKMVSMFNLHREPNRLSLSSLSQHLILNRNKGLLDLVMKRLTHHLRTRRVRNVASPGELNFGAAIEELELDLIAGAAEALQADLADMDVDEALLERLAQQIDGVIANLPELLKGYIERELALRGNEAMAHELEHLKGAYDYRFNEHERRQMEEIVRRLGRQMRGALSSRRTTSTTGRINLSRTLRGNLKYDGVPFHPVLANRRNERPRLVLICDVSLSVRNTARFMLHLVYSLQSLFSKVRSYVFVSDLAEITAEVERSSLDEAIGRVFSGEVIDTDENSNYGRALEIFYERHLAAVTGRTTLIILGDGRGNYSQPNAWVLEELRRRCKQLIWLTPEARASWQLGGSDMPTYAPICHRVEVVRIPTKSTRLEAATLGNSEAL
ncbi:MAG: VWA domain-containing protein, partial [Chloroflexales bacterium]|nr:VWA domain-containing protein [Chloroflexales bacterium]